MQGKTITGRDKRDDIYDFYETPKWATEKVVEALLEDKSFMLNLGRDKSYIYFDDFKITIEKR